MSAHVRLAEIEPIRPDDVRVVSNPRELGVAFLIEVVIDYVPCL